MNTTLQIRVVGSGAGDVKGADSSLPRVYSGQRMYGALDVSSQTGSAPAFDAAEIVFEGNITSFIHSAIVNEGASWTVKRQLIHLTDSQPSSNFHSTSPLTPATANSTVHTNFHFDIPSTATHLSSSPLSADCPLPPSATLRKAYTGGKGPADRGDGRSGTCTVTYQIRARLILRHAVVAETVRKVQLIPLSDAAPPLDAHAFADEFALSASTSILEPLKLKKRGQLSVSVVEPAPLIFSGESAATTASTRLALKLWFRSSSKHVSLPDLADCTVTSSLEALTHFSVIPQDIALSRREVKRLPQVAQTEWKAKPQSRKLKLSNWQRVYDNDENMKTWTTTATVDVTPSLDAGASILPTFRSAFVSRRYALALKVKVRSPSETLAHLTLDLTTPVQVLYTSATGDGVVGKDGDVAPVVQIECGGCRDRKRIEDLQVESALEGPPIYTYH